MAKIEDKRLYILREREYYESARGQQLFQVAKSELDSAENDGYGIIREEATRVLCLVRNPKDYMENILAEREAKGEPLYPAMDAIVSAPKQDQGRVQVEEVSELMIKDVSNNGILQPLREGDVLTRGGGMVNFVVRKVGEDFVAQAIGELAGDVKLNTEEIRKRAYRKIGTEKENPEMMKV